MGTNRKSIDYIIREHLQIGYPAISNAENNAAEGK